MKEYWIVLGSQRKVEVYRRPEDGRYQEMRTFGPDETLECGCVPEVLVRVADLFA